MTKKCTKKYFNLKKNLKMKINKQRNKLVNSQIRLLNIMELTHLFILDNFKIKMKINKLDQIQLKIESKILNQQTMPF